MHHLHRTVCLSLFHSFNKICSQLCVTTLCGVLSNDTSSFFFFHQVSKAPSRAADVGIEITTPPTTTTMLASTCDDKRKVDSMETGVTVVTAVGTTVVTMVVTMVHMNVSIMTGGQRKQ